MKTAVIYARYSCDRQNEQSIDGQLRVCKSYAEKNDIFIVDEYIDKAMSGTNDNRDAFQKMLRDSDKKTWDYVIVYKLDRFSRNKYEMAIHRKHLKDNGISILSAMENIPDGPEGILLESLLEGMNQYYSEELSQKTKRGMNETRLKGNFIGGTVNYGWERDGAKLKINQDEAEIVKYIFSEYANGKKVGDIAKDLNNKGIKNKGKQFMGFTISSILMQEKYTGIYRVNGQEYDKIYPQIIDKEVYEITRKRREANRHGKHVANVIYFLKGKVYCGYCGKKLVSFTGKSSTGELFRYYKCPSVKQTTNCKNRTIRKELLEEIVNKAIKKTFTYNKNLETLVNKILEVNQKRNKEKSTLNILQSNLANVNKSISNMVNAIEQGIITETTKSRLTELEQNKKDIEEKIAIELSQRKSEITKEDIIKYIKYSLNQCPQNMIDLLIKKVNILCNRIEITFNYSKRKDIENAQQSFLLFNEKICTNHKYRGNKIIKSTKIYEVVLMV